MCVCITVLYNVDALAAICFSQAFILSHVDQSSRRTARRGRLFVSWTRATRLNCVPAFARPFSCEVRTLGCLMSERRDGRLTLNIYN